MIDTRLTRLFGLTCPVVLAPTPGLADGSLAAAVARAGGLGLIGAGERDADWIERQFQAAGNEPVGCGFTTSHLAKSPELLDMVLARRPRAVFLSHGDPRPFAPRIAQANVPLICQVQDLQGAALAVEAGADVVVAQSSVSSEKSGARTTFALLPEVADFLYREAHDTLLLAAGAIADSRGLAAALVMGADGVVMGARLWASEEGQVHSDLAKVVLHATGDDRVQALNSDENQPEPVVAPTLRNLHATIPVGEGIGLIRDMPPVGDILNTITQKAERLMVHAQRKVIS